MTTPTLNLNTAGRKALIEYLKANNAYTGHSRDGLDALRTHALATARVIDATVAAAQGATDTELTETLVPATAQRELPEQAHAPVPDPDTDPAWAGAQVFAALDEALATGLGTMPAAPQASDDRMERLTLAKAEHQALQAWVAGGKDGERPATPNLDAMNDDYAAGTRSTRKAGKGAGRQVAPRRAEANAIAAKGKRGAGRRVTDAELNLHIATVMAEHPEATRNDELEYAYWVAGLAVTRSRWGAAWAYVEAAGHQAVTDAKGETPSAD